MKSRKQYTCNSKGEASASPYCNHIHNTHTYFNTTLKTSNMQKQFIVREPKIVWQPCNIKQSAMPKISNAQDAYNVVKNFFVDTLNYCEQFSVLLLNRNNRVIGHKIISTGGVSSTVVDPKIIFNAAVLALASAIIVVHNHPSGNLQPSESDKQLTRKLAQGATLLEMKLLDHIIISEDGFYSFADNETI